MRARSAAIAFVVTVGVGAMCLVIWSFATGSGAKDVDPEPGQPGQLLTLGRDGPPVQSDNALHEALSGSLEPSDTLVLGAACTNMNAWAVEETVDLAVVVATDSAFARVAELIAEGSHDVGLVGAVEAALLDGAEAGGLPELLVPEFEVQAVESYLDDRSMPPSDQVTRRYGAYAASVTLSRQIVVFADFSLANGDGRTSAPTGLPISVTQPPNVVLSVDPDECIDRVGP